MDFERMVQQSWANTNATNRSTAANDAAWDGHRAQFDATLLEVGKAAARTLASHGIRSQPYGQSRKRLGFDVVQQQGVAWTIVDGFYLFDNGTWWHAYHHATGNDAVPFAKLIGQDGILIPNKQLAGGLLRPDHRGYLAGSLSVGGGYGDSIDVDVWFIDGIARVGYRGSTLKSSKPFAEWVADRVAERIAQR